MIRRILIVVLAIQLACALAIAWGVLRWSQAASPLVLVAGPASAPSGWTVAAAVAIGLACVLAGRLLISLHNFYQAWRGGSATPPAHRLRAGGVLRLFLSEFKASMLATSVFMLRGRRSLHAASGATLPVLLIHGYGANSGFWLHLGKLLRQRNVCHFALDMEPIGASIDDYAAAIAEEVARLCAASGREQVILIGHSMGGLAARAYLRRHGARQVTRLITLGSPHHGTELADLGPGVNCSQMRRNADWLTQLGASEDAATRALIVSLWSHHDNIVVPQDSSHLPGAFNVEFSGIGHVALGADPRILQFVLDEIERSSSIVGYRCAQ